MLPLTERIRLKLFITGGHAEIRRKFIHLGCRLLFCKAFLQKWPHQSRGLVKVLDAVERDAIKPAEKRFG